MKVYKFGGASVKDASSVRNVVEVLKKTSYENVFIVVSAMGKTTNALERVVGAYFDESDYESILNEVQDNHLTIAKELFSENSTVFDEIKVFFSDVNAFLRRNKSPKYDFVYDQVVSCGEMISTKILSAYMNDIGLDNQWIDIRDYLKTDSNYREGKVDFEQTEENFKKLPQKSLYITQGFIGSNDNYFTVTLGREGSDYTAAIIAYCLNAESMTIWKDVPGVLNGDPREFSDTVLLESISYLEAIELAYYGASVIHPKTMKPLQNKEIPFYVKSFIEPLKPGTSIQKGHKIVPKVPCYIVKKNQILLNISAKDFSFIAEENLKEIYELITENKLKVNLLQVSALKLSLCIEDKYNKINEFIESISDKYLVKKVEDTILYTSRHFNQESQNKLTKDKVILLEQVTKNTFQVVVQN
ncbi:MAG: aspartate kinase [Flavobacteriales bacterium]|nr:aspartate kinase [Flavobacteriales bacterium]